MKSPIKVILFMIIALTFGHPVFGSTDFMPDAPGPHFNVVANPAANFLSVQTTTPGWYYQYAGIKILTTGYRLLGNDMPSGNGYYLFSVSDLQPARFNIFGPGGELAISLCLNGMGQTYGCEVHRVAIHGPPTVFSVDRDSGVVTGNALVPGLGEPSLTRVTTYILPFSTPGVCDTSRTFMVYFDLVVGLSNTAMLIPPDVPGDCAAFCNSVVVSPTYPGQSNVCSNAAVITP